MNDIIICDTPDKIMAFQLLSIRSALKLETLGMKFSRGSVAQKVRGMLGVKTRNKKDLLASYEAFLQSKGYIK